MRRRTRGLGVAALAVIAVLQCHVAAAQSIKIPDFRQGTALPPDSPEGSCADCGTVRSVREVQARRDPSRVAGPNPGPPSSGAFDSRVVGAVVVLPFGTDKNAYVGGVGTSEMNERFGGSTYEVIVRMDDGAYRTVERRDGARFGIGDRVRVAEGRIEALPSIR